MVHASGSLRSTIARWLEAGAPPWAQGFTQALALAHQGFAARAVARPLAIPHGVVIITVGGATLGGSGKTRVALAVVRALVQRGAEVILVGHAYRASPLRARIVSVDDAIADVGDEALMCARALVGVARVVVAPRRQQAIDLAASLGSPFVVVDGPLQLAPVRSSLALLAIDAQVPWGSGALPPRGDLRAAPAALLAHADVVVRVDATPRAVVVDGVVVELATFAAAMAGRRLGLFTAIARPSRLETALRSAGLDLPIVVRASDHGPVSLAIATQIRATPVDLWLATDKCALHLGPVVGDRSIAFLDGTCELSLEAVAALDRCVTRRGAPRWSRSPHTASLDPSIAKALVSSDKGGSENALISRTST